MGDFDSIYSEYFTEVYRFVLSLCRDPVLAEEITQEAFFKALKSIDSFKGECRLGTWLCSIARNTYLSHAEKNKRLTELPEDMPDSLCSIEEKFDDKETARAIHRILHGMKEPYKEVFWQRAFGELSFAQIAGLFGKTETWARVTYYRAKMMIKEELE